MEAEHVERRLAAILAADVAAYSRLMGTDEEGTLARLKAHRRELVDPKIAEHRGRIVKTTGDGLLVEFQSVVDAVRCAVEWQRGMAERNAGVPAEGRIDFRIGINVGDIIIDGGDIFGDGVNIAARLEGLAEPGGICVSRVVRDQVRDKLAFGFKNMGEQTVKNIARPVPVHRVILDGESGDEGGDDDVEPKPGPIGRGAKSLPLSRWLLATLGLLIVVAAIASLAWWRAQTGRSAGNGPRVAAGGWAAAAADASLVVLNFANGTGDRDQDYLNAGFTEDLVSALAHFQGVRVVNRNPSSTPGDASSIARRLGTRYVLTGRYRRDGNQIDVDTQMIDAKNGSVLWDEHETRETRDVSTVEDTVLRHVIGTLGVFVDAADIARAQRKPPRKPEAYDLALKGRALLHEASRQANSDARDALQRAAELDPTYAVAYAYLAQSDLDALANRWTEDGRIAPMVRQTADLAGRAVALDEDFGFAHAVLATALTLSGQHEAAAANANRAAALSPGDTQILARAGETLSFAGKHQAAVELANKAIAIEPTASAWNLLARGRFFLGDYPDSAQAAASCVERQPRYQPCRAILAAAYGALGDTAKARTAREELMRLAPRMTVETLVRRRLFVNAADAERLADGLKKAGVPE